MRRVFYPSRPTDVIWGFLTLALTGGLVGAIVYRLATGHVNGAIALLKLCPLVILGVSKMLYRERVVVNMHARTVTAEKWFFLLPLEREEFPVREVSSVEWALVGKGYELQLTRRDGTRYLLARARLKDEALERELQAAIT